MRYPSFLHKNGTIGFVAPSFGCATEPYKTAFLHAQEIFSEAGYQLQFGPNCYLSEGIGISSTPIACGTELTESYVGSENDVLISCGGGELMCEILEYIDFEQIKNSNPKWYMGYSDNTNFTFLLTTICDVASIYGPCAATFGMEKWHPSVQDAFDLLQGKLVQENRILIDGYDLWERESLKSEENPLAPYNVTEPSVLHCFVGDGVPMNEQTEELNTLQMSGRLIGGCLDCLVNLCGTEFDQVKTFVNRYKEDGFIWFLEACDLNVMSIRRAIWELKHAGWFEYVNGFVIGRPLHFGEEMMGLNQYNAVYDILSEYKVPILMDADIGHVAPMVPLICGSFATVQANGNNWQVQMELR